MSNQIIMLETVGDLEKGQTYRLRSREAHDLIADGKASANLSEAVESDAPVVQKPKRGSARRNDTSKTDI